jgi:glutaminyl-tRNA synthetase
MLGFRIDQTRKAYVDEQSSEDITAQRKNPFEPGVNSPFRDRPIAESLELLRK